MLNLKKSILALSVAGLLAAPLGAHAAPAKIELEGGMFGGTLYNIGFAISELAKKHMPDTQIIIAETSGSAAGIIKMNKSPKDRLAMSTTVSVQEAVQGRKPYPKEFKNLKVLACVADNINFMISLDPKIDSLEKLSGKRLGYGNALAAIGQPHWRICKPDIPGSDNMKPSFLNWGALKAGMMDGGLDAIVMGVTRRAEGNWPPIPSYHEIVAAKGVPTFIGLNEASIKAASERDGISYPVFKIPAGCIAENQPPHDMIGWADSLAVTCESDFPEETAYQIVKMLYEHCAEMGVTNAAARGLWPEMIVSYTVPDELIHPGALRFLKEIGLRK